MALATDPIDWKLDADGDLDVGTDLAFAAGLDAVAQGVRIILLTFKGEWFLDLDHGVPYMQELLGYRFSPLKTQQAFRAAILTVPGVEEISSIEVSLSPATRALRVVWSVRTRFGDTPEEVTEVI